jgi:hypothetical protein
MMRPAVTYGLEMMRMMQEMDNILAVFENNILRRICGPKRRTRKWRRRGQRGAEVAEKA